ncbi:zinc ribbon domain-containing protein [Streptomyces sp. NPDC001970]
MWGAPPSPRRGSAPDPAPTPRGRGATQSGWVFKLPLRVRTYVCEHCGLVIDRDENAVLNLAALVKRHVAGSGPETENGRGADRKTPPRGAGGREASTPH